MRAGLLLALGLRCPRRRDGGPTREARKFRPALGRCRDDDAYRRLAARTGGVGGAYAIRSGPPGARSAVEPRLLTGESVAAIAAKEVISSESVSWYESLFFYVSDRLMGGSYIALAVIGPAAIRGIGGADLGAFRRLPGYHGGPAVLDLAIAAMGPALTMSAHEEAARAAQGPLRLALTSIAIARAPRRGPWQGEAERFPRRAAAGRKGGRRSADPPPPGTQGEPAGPPAGTRPGAGSRARNRGRRRAASCDVGDGARALTLPTSAHPDESRGGRDDRLKYGADGLAAAVPGRASRARHLEDASEVLCSNEPDRV